MCSTCGCGQPDDEVKMYFPGEEKEEASAHDPEITTPGDHHGHEGNRHSHSHGQTHSHEGHDHSHSHGHTHGHGHSHGHDYGHDHDHDHDHDHGHGHNHGHHQGHRHAQENHTTSDPHTHSHNTREIDLEQDVLYKNNLLAERNRGFFEARNITALNLVSSPGSGKTTLLENTIKKFQSGENIYIIEGDQQTSNDADRIAATGVKVVQINTGKGCHLDAHMILHGVQKLNPVQDSLLMIENVGNLVCPAMFDLGEKHRVVIMSITEGEDKPIKYPDMFLSSQVCLINKIDLLPYIEFDLEKAKEYALRVNPNLQIFEVSATSGEGMDEWVSWLKGRIKKKVEFKN